MGYKAISRSFGAFGKQMAVAGRGSLWYHNCKHHCGGNEAPLLALGLYRQSVKKRFVRCVKRRLGQMRKITVFGTTLRDGEQAPGCTMNTWEKLEFAKQLERLGVE